MVFQLLPPVSRFGDNGWFEADWSVARRLKQMTRLISLGIAPKCFLWYDVLLSTEIYGSSRAGISRRFQTQFAKQWIPIILVLIGICRNLHPQGRALSRAT